MVHTQRQLQSVKSYSMQVFWMFQKPRNTDCLMGRHQILGEANQVKPCLYGATMDSEENPKTLRYSCVGSEKKLGVSRGRRVSPKHASASTLVTVSTELRGSGVDVEAAYGRTLGAQALARVPDIRRSAVWRLLRASVQSGRLL